MARDIRPVWKGLKARAQRWTAGVIGGGREYAPFVIFCTARTGSEYLRSLLNAHAGVITWGALFAPASRRSIRWGFVGQPQGKALRSRLLEQPAGFLDEMILTAYPASVSAVGFKLFYGHARRGPWAGVWDYLRGREDLRVIHLKRRNRLARQLSLERAKQSGQWRNRSGRQRAPAPVRLDFDRCVAEFELTERWERTVDDWFSQHRKLELFYEDLSAEQGATMGRVFDFLDVAAEPVRASTHRQSFGSLATNIANYEELRSRFAGSRWQSLFEQGAPTKS